MLVGQYAALTLYNPRLLATTTCAIHLHSDAVTAAFINVDLGIIPDDSASDICCFDEIFMHSCLRHNTT